jgi:AP2 domain-containing protein
MRQIPLHAKDRSIRAHALVDDEDFEHLSQWQWSLNWKGYAVRSYRRDGKRFQVRMHRVVLGLTAWNPTQVDHRDRNKLNNQKANLRLANPAQQRQNVDAIGGRSQHRGVTFDPKRNRWVAQGFLDGKNHHVGRFKTEEEARLAAIEWRQRNMPYSTD